MLDNIHVYTPAELCKISRAYSKQETRQYALCKKLGEQVVDRMVGFAAVDVVDILGPMWIMLPGDNTVFEAIEKHIIVKREDFTALNLIGIVRIFNKRSTKHHDLMSQVLPRLRELLKDYEAYELTEMLLSIAQSSEAQADMDILLTLVPEIERRYGEYSLVHAINNVWALAQLKVSHQGLLSKVAEDLANPKKTKGLTPTFMARVVWIYRRCNAWDMVKDTLLPMIRESAAEFECGDFARLAQAVPEEGKLLRNIAELLRVTLSEMGRKDAMLFILGCVHGELWEVAREAPEDEETLVGQCLKYCREEQDNFKRDEVQKLVYLLRFAPKYRHLLDDLPASWNPTKEETLDFIKARA